MLENGLLAVADLHESRTKCRSVTFDALSVGMFGVDTSGDKRIQTY